MHISLRSPVIFALLALLTLTYAGTAQAGTEPAYGPRLEGFEYPWPVQQYHFRSQGQALEMAYMDVVPTHPNGRVVVLLHGKNFCAATWQGTIGVLSGAGYRVTLIGHSTGGMLGIRYALMYAPEVKQMVLVDPIGLEDWKARGVPWQSVDAWYQRELETTADRIRSYERNTYYAGTWDPSYESWVQMLAGMYRGFGREQVAWDSALLYDMIYTQPVIYELENLRMPVLLIVGDKDNTAIGKDLAPPEVRATLGNYSVLGKAAAARIPHAKLVEFPDLGHAPQLQAPERFHKTLLEWLQKTHSAELN
jgi:pimeloyl-ACP methyl ester carboxylesterase